MNYAVLIQVSLKSKRLPNKALADVCGKPLIQRVHERVIEANLPVIWCIRQRDTELVDLADSLGVAWYEGHWDAMQRMVDCAEERGIGNIVRVTGDNPLTCPVGIAAAASKHYLYKLDYSRNPIPRPRGMRCEVVSMDWLKRCRESYPIKDSEPVFGHLIAGEWPKEVKQEHAAYGVNWPDDLEFIRGIYAHYGDNLPTSEEIIATFPRE